MQDLLQTIWNPEDSSILLSIHGTLELYVFDGFAPRSGLKTYLKAEIGTNTTYLNEVLATPHVKAYGAYSYGANPAQPYYLYFLGSSYVPGDWRNKSKNQVDNITLTKAIAESAALLRALPNGTTHP